MPPAVYPVALRPIEGETGVRLIFEETLDATGEILGFSNVEAIERILKDYLHFYAEERLRRRIKSRLICPYTKLSEQFLNRYFASDALRQYNETVFVDPLEFPFESNVYVYGNRVASFSASGKVPFGFVIDSPELAQSYSSIFNLAWLGGTSFLLS